MSYEERLREYADKRARDNYDREHYEALQRQREIAAQNRHNKHVDGLGQATMEIDNAVYNKWVQKEGKDIWKDKSFRERMKREHPELRAGSDGPRKIQVGYGS